eukprot:scaffold319_cov244-Pinguiococcus_pyrenoidosus.AAC.3
MERERPLPAQLWLRRRNLPVGRHRRQAGGGVCPEGRGLPRRNPYEDLDDRVLLGSQAEGDQRERLLRLHGTGLRGQLLPDIAGQGRPPTLHGHVHVVGLEHARLGARVHLPAGG